MESNEISAEEDKRYTVNWGTDIEYIGELNSNKLDGKGEMKFKDGHIAMIRGTWR